MAVNNGYPKKIIEKLRTRITNKKLQKTRRRKGTQKWTTFTFFSPLIRQETKIFKDTNLNIASFKTTNTIQQQLSRENTKNINPSGIYKLLCNTCNMAYIGQSSRSINTRYKEHIKYIRYNNPQSAHATHTLQKKHEYGPARDTLKLLKAYPKGTRLSCWENLYMQTFHKHGILITEQKINEFNPL